MTKVYVYVGKENPKTIEHGTSFIARDLRGMVICNNDTCPLSSKPQPNGKTISFGSDLHACKQNKECRDNVGEKWEHLKKSFNPESYLAERITFHQEKGFTYEEATKYAKIDVEEKLKELRIEKVRKKKNEWNPKFRERQRKLMKRTNELVKQEHPRKEAYKLAHKEIYE